MCVAIKFQNSEVRWNASGAALPVTNTETGEIVTYPWGRRKWNEEGKLYSTGWARRESIEQGKWKRFHPEFVLISALAFMERDLDKNPHWVDLESNQFISGLLAVSGDEMRVYVITVPPHEPIFKRWPEIVSEA